MFLSWTKLLFSYLLLIEFTTKFANATRYPHFRTANTRWNPKYFSNFTFQIQNNSLYASIDVLKPLHSGFKAHVEVQIRLAGSKSYQTLFTYNLDICSVAGNFMQNCPIYSGHYYLEGWRLQPDLIPTYLYAGNYRLKGYTFYGKYKGKDEDFLVQIDMDIDLLDHA